MVISAEGKAQERAVHTGVMQGAEWQITEGLQAGDRVIINGAEKLAPDTPVTAKTAHAPAQSKNNN
jgi:multidrug efflux system membrane fusion protein